MRITLISSWGSPCGISVYAGDVYSELVKRGHEVQVLAYEESLPTEVKLELPVHRAWKLCQPPSWQILQRIHEFQPDVIQIQHEIGFFSPGAVWREWLECLESTKVPVVVTYHSLPDVPNVLTDLPVALAIVCSPLGGEILRSRADFPVMTIEHGVDGAISRERQPEPYSMASFGFLSESKGYHRILEAMRLLRAELPQLNLTILGSLTPRAYDKQINYFHQLQRMVNQLGLMGQVDVTCGFRTQREVHACLSRKAIGVLHYDRTDRMKVEAAFLDEGSQSTAESLGTSGPVLQDVESSLSMTLGTSGFLGNAETPLRSRMPTMADDGSSRSFRGPRDVDVAPLVAMLGSSGPILKSSDYHGQPSRPNHRQAELGDVWLPRMGTVGVRCQSAALYRMWSAGLPCIVSQAQHFEVGGPAAEALIRARDVPQMADEIRRLFNEPEAYQAAVARLGNNLTRTWKDVADDYESAFSRVVQSC